jgi:hypothetical protein
MPWSKPKYLVIAVIRGKLYYLCYDGRFRHWIHVGSESNCVKEYQQKGRAVKQKDRPAGWELIYVVTVHGTAEYYQQVNNLEQLETFPGSEVLWPLSKRASPPS